MEHNKEAIMAKVRAHKKTPDQITRDDLEAIVGVGARNIGMVEVTVKKALKAKDPADIVPRDLAVRGQISSDTASNVAKWIHDNVEDIDWDDADSKPRIVTTEEIFAFDEEEGEVPVNGSYPLLALAFDPEATLQQAADFLVEHQSEAGDLGKRLALVQGWLRGEYLAPAPASPDA